MSSSTEPVCKSSAFVNLTVENVSCSLSPRLVLAFWFVWQGRKLWQRGERNIKIWLVILSEHRYFPCCLCRIHSGSLCLCAWGCVYIGVRLCNNESSLLMTRCTNCLSTYCRFVFIYQGFLVVSSPFDLIPFYSFIYLSTLLYCFDSLSRGLFWFNERLILLLC